MPTPTPPEPFATTDDLGMPEGASQAEVERTEQLIAEASAILRAEVRRLDARLDAGTLDPILPQRVVVAMVRRVMYPEAATSRMPEGVTTLQRSTGPFSHSVTLPGPVRVLTVWPSELRQLQPRPRAGSVDLTQREE